MTGSSGNIIRWESSTDNFVTTNSIVNTGLVQPFSNLTVTTRYRAVVGLAGCPSVNSAPATITVNPVAVAGSLASNASIVCSGTSVNLTLTGSVGNIFGFQASNDDYTTSTIINSNLATLTQAPTESIQYRAVLTSGTCPVVLSNSVAVLVTPRATLSAPTITQPTCTTQGSIVVNAKGLGSTIINGSLASGDATQTNRPGRDRIVSECGYQKPSPEPIVATGIIYDKYTFTNPSASPVCVTVTL